MLKPQRGPELADAMRTEHGVMEVLGIEVLVAIEGLKVDGSLIVGPEGKLYVQRQWPPEAA